ncbi:membrane-bound transcription factor site-2 protease [Cimex lectularius]|uniref:Membrane-bound transcription factor site-2 protease n=1 Tax=Cimex lectularius TaxID=79782 RepID=A0A8I6R6R7_CIMLE|nr:membrane-bound transcription factor site-2 protease [Cimex lectularius]
MDELFVFLIAALIVHLSLLFFDVVFKSCSHYPYLYFLSKTGIQILPFRINWFTTAFNRQIQKWSSKRPKLQTAWFTAGTWVSICIMPMAFLLIMYTTYVTMRSSYYVERNMLIVEPLVPGWNLPSSDFGYYLLTLFISSMIHEMGHAMAAVREGIHLGGFGMTIFFVIPVVMTHLENLDSLQPLKQLRVLCAGVWHNIFLALVAAVIATTLPWFFYPFFNFGTGVQVQSVKLGSSISGEGGLLVGDKITHLSGCPVQGSTSWQECLLRVLHEPHSGFCLQDSFIREHDESIPAKHISESVIECCGVNNPRHLCFEYIGSDDEPLPLPQHTCLFARRVIQLSLKTCVKAKECPYFYHCFRPSLENSTKLVHIKREKGDDVLFLGNPAEIYHSVQISDFISLSDYFPSAIPDAITKLCQFLTIFSSGLAVLNIIPCFFFDGEHIIKALIELTLSKRLPLLSARQVVHISISLFGTMMLCVYVCVMLFSVV